MLYEMIVAEKKEKAFVVEANSLEEAIELAEKGYRDGSFKIPDDESSDVNISGTQLPECQIRIYQIDLDKDSKNVSFERLSVLTELQGFSDIDSSIYNLVYDGPVYSSDLEDIYRKFNLDFPEEYVGRSMSVSDVVEIIDNDGNSSFFFCDAIGFKKINFEPEKTTKIC